jgi:hypothetical protein
MYENGTMKPINFSKREGQIKESDGRDKSN